MTTPGQAAQAYLSFLICHWSFPVRGGPTGHLSLYQRGGGGERNIVRFQVQFHRGVWFEAILNEGFRERVFDVSLDGTPEGARAVGSILAGLLNDPRANFRPECDKKLFLLHHIV